MKRILPAIISLILILGCMAYLYMNPVEEEVEIIRTEAYVCSAGLSVPVYCENNNLLHKDRDLIRGTAVISRNINVDVNDGSFLFTEIELEGETDEEGNPTIFYISSNNLCSDKQDAVRSSSKFARTSLVVYETPGDARIASFLKKGTELSVCGYDELKEDGSVDMFRIDNEGSEGYVYAKYVVDTQEQANEPYALIAGNHVGREYEFELYGGSAETLDWYPYEKPVLAQGAVPEDIRAVYLNFEAVRPENIDSYLTLAAESGANAFVIDIKDGLVVYPSEVASRLCPSAYEDAYMTEEEFRSSLQKIQDAGIYTIGRVVTFNDNYYAYDHPDECIITDYTDVSWPSAYSRNCWYYNVALAVEAVRMFGLNEIQFDYVRFPENAYYMSQSPVTDYLNTYDEEKAEAIQNFCIYATDQVHNAGAYVSVDVFGECVNGFVTAYGQYWAAISNVVDVISGMPYTDHFGYEEDTWSYPYTTVYEWAGKAALRQKEVRTPAVVRTWITGYDTPNWDPVVTYGETQLIEQAQALYDSGLTGGFIPWNYASDLGKYYSYIGVWGADYSKE